MFDQDSDDSDIELEEGMLDSEKETETELPPVEK